jgi:membrane-bound lytic murein transglycosylase B
MARSKFGARSPRRSRGAHGWTETDRLAPAADEVRAPGLAAMLRRNPKVKQRAAVGSIAAGAVIFVVASLTTPLADANTAHPAHGVDAQHDANGGGLGQLLPLATDSATPPAEDKVLTGKPVHVAKPAPTDAAVINSLASNGIPNMALNAYRVAAARMDHVDPGCGIDWALLAGIGRVESDHGRFGGAVFNANGTTTPKIIGPALDGRTWDYVPAPANGLALDGDAVYAHALGPMQFIPQTWAGYGADENGDGVADVFNINDAALGAARYLCAAGGDLRTTAGQQRAVLTYNHSDEYLGQVLALADAYRRGVDVTGIPLVGNTSGSLSPVRTTDVPPANPGNPTAVQHHGTTAKKPTATKTSGSPSKTAGRPGGSPSGTNAVTPVHTSTPGGTTTSPGGSTSGNPGTTSAPPAPPSTTSKPPTSNPPTSNPPTSSSPSPSPTPTKKCTVPNPFKPGTCLIP